MCSTKWAIPLRSSLSCRDPRVSQTPMLTDRTCGIVSVTSRRPLSRTSRTIIAKSLTERAWPEAADCLPEKRDHITSAGPAVV